MLGATPRGWGLRKRRVAKSLQDGALLRRERLGEFRRRRPIADALGHHHAADDRREPRDDLLVVAKDAHDKSHESTLLPLAINEGAQPIARVGRAEAVELGLLLAARRAREIAVETLMKQLLGPRHAHARV